MRGSGPNNSFRLSFALRLNGKRHDCLHLRAGGNPCQNQRLGSDVRETFVSSGSSTNSVLYIANCLRRWRLFQKDRFAGSLVEEKCRLYRMPRPMRFRCQIQRRRALEFHAPWANRLLPGNVLSKKLIEHSSGGIIFGSVPPEI